MGIIKHCSLPEKTMRTDILFAGIIRDLSGNREKSTQKASIVTPIVAKCLKRMRLLLIESRIANRSALTCGHPLSALESDQGTGGEPRTKGVNERLLSQ